MPFGGLLTAGVSAGSSLLGGIFGSKGASQAAQEQAQAEEQGLQFTQQQLNNANSLISGTAVPTVQAGTTAATNSIGTGVTGATAALSPYATAGTTATGALQQLATTSPALTQAFSFNPNNLASNPGYQFTLQQGQQAIQRAAAAQGNLLSGGTLKSLSNYTTGAANQYFNTAYNQALSTFQANQAQAQAQAGVLSNLMGGGLSASTTSAQDIYGGGVATGQTQLQGATTQAGLYGQQAQLGLQGAGTIAQLMGNIGNAQAAGTVGSTNAWLNALQGGSNALTGYLGTQNLYSNINPYLINTGSQAALQNAGASLPPTVALQGL